jgi:hypothetical protein
MKGMRASHSASLQMSNDFKFLRSDWGFSFLLVGGEGSGDNARSGVGVVACKCCKRLGW